LEFVDYKPLPLLYEEILSSQAQAYEGKNDLGEFALKKRVAAAISSLPSGNFHGRLMQADVRHVLTTNYDYNLERALGRAKRSNLRSESKYSVFRRRGVSGKFVWHIHGEADAPATITLGYEQYCGYLQQLRNYATAERKAEKGSPFKRGDNQFDAGDDCVYSWLDVFFRDDVHIVGLALDFFEIDLWWALSYKRRLAGRGYSVGTTYFHDWHLNEIDDATRARNSLLKGLGVQVRSATAPRYESLYEEFLTHELGV
jgi:hypothetical protein